MPNWCYGSLTITCSEELRETIRNYVQSDEKVFDLNRIIPVDDDNDLPLHEIWGSCSNVDEECAYDTGYTFVTAWMPCSRAVEKLAKSFPEASFRYVYDESGTGFCGAEAYENGQLVYSLDADYHEIFSDDDDDTEDEPFIDLDILPVSGNEIDVRFIPTGNDGEWTFGQIYYREQVDEYWGRQFKGEAKYKGEQPVDWF